MKFNLFFLILCLIFIGCSKEYPPDSKEFPPKITRLGISIFENGDGEKIINIQDHPLKSFNGKYLEQRIKINDTSYFRNENNRYLYFYDQAEGGEKGWSLDHRKPDGIKDYYSGGYFYLEKFKELDKSCVNWQSVDQGIFMVLPNASIVELREWINDGSNPKVVTEYYGYSLIDYAKELGRDDIIEYLKTINEIPQTNAILDEKITSETPSLANDDSSESFKNQSEQKRSSLDPENQKQMGMEEIKERIFQAASNGNAKYVNLLLMKGANVNAKKSKTGATLLHTASLRGHIDVVELLISKGANVNSTNNKGQTPLSFAISRNHSEIVDLLKKNGAQATEELKESTISK